MRDVQPQAEVVTLTDDGHGSVRASFAELSSARRPPRARARAPRHRAGRARRHLRLEQPAPLRALLRRALHGRGAAHAQRAPVRRAAHLHRQPRRGPRDLRRRLARAAAGAARAELSSGRALRRAWATGRTRPGPIGSLPSALRYEELLEDARRRRRALRVPRARRAPGGRALLHERHHRQPQGRALLAPLDQPALDRHADRRRLGLSRARSRAGGRADVPRQRLGAALRRRAGRRRPDPARPLPRGRAARAR